MDGKKKTLKLQCNFFCFSRGTRTVTSTQGFMSGGINVREDERGWERGRKREDEREGCVWNEKRHSISSPCQLISFPPCMLFIPLLSPILFFSLSFLTVKSFDLFSPQFLQTRTFDNTPVLPVKYQERCWLSDWVIAFLFSLFLSLWNWGDFCLNALEVKREREREREIDSHKLHEERKMK